MDVYYCATAILNWRPVGQIRPLWSLLVACVQYVLFACTLYLVGCPVFCAIVLYCTVCPLQCAIGFVSVHFISSSYFQL